MTHKILRLQDPRPYFLQKEKYETGFEKGKTNGGPSWGGNILVFRLQCMVYLRHNFRPGAELISVEKEKLFFG